MRNFVILLTLSLMLFSCKSEDKVYTLKYKVYYSDNNVKEYTVSNSEGYRIGSNRGSNYIMDREKVSYIEDTSAPIEVISYKSRPK